MRYLLFITWLGSLYAQDLPDTLDKAASLRIISAFQNAGTMFSGAHTQFMRVTPFWKNIYKLSVPYGLNKDPVPDPAIFYVMPDTTFESDFLSVLKKLKYYPVDKTDAVHIAVLLVQEANDNALIPVKKADLKTIPQKVRKKYGIELPEAEGSPQKGYEVELFSYQTYQPLSFSQAYRPEVVKEHEITIENGMYDWQVKEWVLKR